MNGAGAAAPGETLLEYDLNHDGRTDVWKYVVKDASGNPLTANGGPNLTHLASRECFAGCWPHTASVEDLSKWLDNPASVKQGSWMPDYNLTPDEIQALVAYLQSLT